jgi:hypothetical protein
MIPKLVTRVHKIVASFDNGLCALKVARPRLSSGYNART